MVTYPRLKQQDSITALLVLSGSALVHVMVLVVTSISVTRVCMVRGYCFMLLSFQWSTSGGVADAVYELHLVRS